MVYGSGDAGFTLKLTWVGRSRDPPCGTLEA